MCVRLGRGHGGQGWIALLLRFCLPFPGDAFKNANLALEDGTCIGLSKASDVALSGLSTQQQHAVYGEQAWRDLQRRMQTSADPCLDEVCPKMTPLTTDQVIDRDPDCFPHAMVAFSFPCF